MNDLASILRSLVADEAAGPSATPTGPRPSSLGQPQDLHFYVPQGELRRPPRMGAGAQSTTALSGAGRYQGPMPPDKSSIIERILASFLSNRGR